MAALPPPTIYRTPRGGAGPRRLNLQGGGAAKVRGVPPKPSGAPPTPRVSNPRRRGRPKGGAQAQPGLVPLPLQPMGPSGIGGPTRWTPGTLGGPGTIPVDPETFPMAETRLPIYNSLPPDYSGTPRDVQDLIRDSEQLSDYYILISLQP